MIRYLLLGSAFMLASTVTFATSANAQEATASGMVATSCDFKNPQRGDLILNSGGTALTSVGGTPAKVDIDCNGDATLTISAPKQVKGPSNPLEFTNLTATATSTKLGLNVSSGGTPGNIFANSEGDAIGTIEVNMVANKGSKITPGEYEFTVTLTSTP